ncbi:cytochrome c oxidase subunit 7c, mitochondrial [Plakobranchus ocellatus]|uniref:Cytochrome c oxidase subunit 7C, mitochondrial n=1 Tax=Plakobranchus ocellatus TaxID=259542 RepID=A0AAV4CL57_9GAST|nr:cytochrome c oxidase subunit 7c, mitochondrial [Plakobranchus ocellatus]
MVFAQTSRALVRRFTTSAVRRSQEWQQQGVPGSNLPFDIHNKYKLTAMFVLFFGSGLTAPFLIARRHLLLTSAK